MSEHPQPDRGNRDKHVKLMRELQHDHAETIRREQQKFNELEQRLRRVASGAAAGHRTNRHLLSEAQQLMLQLEILLHAPGRLGGPAGVADFNRLQPMVNEYLTNISRASERIAALEAAEAKMEEETLGKRAETIYKDQANRRKNADEAGAKVTEAETKAGVSKAKAEAALAKEKAVGEAHKESERNVRKTRAQFELKQKQLAEAVRLLRDRDAAEVTAKNTAEAEKDRTNNAMPALEQEVARKKRVYEDLVDEYEGTTDVGAIKVKFEEARRNLRRAESDYRTADGEAATAAVAVASVDRKINDLDTTTLPNLRSEVGRVQIDRLRGAVDDKEDEVKVTQADLDREEKKRGADRDEARINGLKQDLIRQRRELSTAKRELADGNEKITNLRNGERDRQQLVERKEELDRKLRTANQMKATKEADRDAAQLIHDEWQARDADAPIRKQELRDAKRDWEEAEANVAHGKEEVRKAAEAFAESERKLKEVQDKLQQLDINFDDLQDEVNKLAADLAEAEKQMQKNQAELRQAKIARSDADVEHAADAAEVARHKAMAEPLARDAEEHHKDHVELVDKNTEQARKRKAEAEGKRAAAEAETKQLRDRPKATVSIEGGELLALIGDLRLSEVVNAAINNPDDTSYARSLLRDVFSSGLTQAQRENLQQQLEQFGYTLEEFIKAWKERLHVRPAEIIAGVVNQERRNWFNTNINWRDTIGTNIWETTKLVAFNVLPTVAVVGGSAALAGLAVSGLGAGVAATTAAAAGTGGLMRGLKKAYGWFTGQGEKRQQALTQARQRVETNRTAEMQRAIRNIFRNPARLEEVAGYISQGLRDSSFEVAHRALTPALLDANTQAAADVALRQIETDYERKIVADESREQEAADEKERQIRRLEAALKQLSSPAETRRLVSDALAKDPSLLELFKKIPGLREMLPAGVATKADRDRAAVVLESALAGVAVGGMLSTVPYFREAMGGLAGAMLGAKIGAGFDRREQERNLRQQFQMHLDRARNLVRQYGTTDRRNNPLNLTDLDTMQRLYTQLNATLSIMPEILDSNEFPGLRVTAQDTMHAMRIIYFRSYLEGNIGQAQYNRLSPAEQINVFMRTPEEAREASVDNLISSLNIDLENLRGEQQRVKDQLLQRSQWRTALGATVGFVGGVVGIHFFGKELRDLTRRAGAATVEFTKDKAHDAWGAITGDEAGESPGGQTGAGREPGHGAETRGVAGIELGIEEHRFATEHHLSEQEFNAGYKPLLQKFPALRNPESMQAIFDASKGGRAIENILGDVKKTIFLQLAERDLAQAKAFLHDEQFFGEKYLGSRHWGHLKGMDLPKDESAALDALAEKVHAAGKGGGDIPKAMDQALHKFFRAEESTDLANHKFSSDDKHDVRIPKTMRVLGIDRDSGKLILGGTGEAKYMLHGQAGERLVIDNVPEGKLLKVYYAGAKTATEVHYQHNHQEWLQDVVKKGGRIVDEGGAVVKLGTHTVPVTGNTIVENYNTSRLPTGLRTPPEFVDPRVADSDLKALYGSHEAVLGKRAATKDTVIGSFRAGEEWKPGSTAVGEARESASDAAVSGGEKGSSADATVETTSASATLREAGLNDMTLRRMTKDFNARLNEIDFKRSGIEKGQLMAAFERWKEHADDVLDGDQKMSGVRLVDTARAVRSFTGPSHDLGGIARVMALEDAKLSSAKDEIGLFLANKDTKLGFAANDSAAVGIWNGKEGKWVFQFAPDKHYRVEGESLVVTDAKSGRVLGKYESVNDFLAKNSQDSHTEVEQEAA